MNGNRFLNCGFGLIQCLVDMHIPRVTTGHGLRCLKYKIPKLWNELLKGLKELTSLNGFKKKLNYT